VSAYPPAVLAHFRNPVGAGRLEADGVRVASGEARDPEGQRVRLHVRLDPDGRLDDVRFQAFGCPIAIAVASVAVERLRGRSRADALALAPAELARALALDPEQARLAELPVRALHAALAYLAPPS
jgi:NifU-like protein involved in Fe-S cluster formation